MRDTVRALPDTGLVQDRTGSKQTPHMLERLLCPEDCSLHGLCFGGERKAVKAMPPVPIWASADNSVTLTDRRRTEGLGRPLGRGARSAGEQGQREGPLCLHTGWAGGHRGERDSHPAPHPRPRELIVTGGKATETEKSGPWERGGRGGRGQEKAG